MSSTTLEDYIISFINACICTHARIPAYMHTCKCACTYACVMHICTYKCMCAYMHICMHVWCICTYACVMHVCMHTSAHLHICPHTCTWTHAFTWAHNASIHMWGLKVVIKVIIQLIFKIFSLSQCILLQCIIIGTMHCCQLADSVISTYCWKPANGVTRHPQEPLLRSLLSWHIYADCSQHLQLLPAFVMGHQHMLESGWKIFCI